MSGQLDQCVVDVKCLNGNAEFWRSKTLCSLCADENDLIMCKMIGDKTPPFFLVQIKSDWRNEYTHASRWILSLSPVHIAYRVILLVCLSLFYELPVNRLIDLFIYLFFLIKNCVWFIKSGWGMTMSFRIPTGMCSVWCHSSPRQYGVAPSLCLNNCKYNVNIKLLFLS